MSIEYKQENNGETIKTALITGASSGIGKAFAILFAKKNFRLVLVARNKERLNSVAEECVKLGAVSPRIFEVDLSVLDETRNLIKLIQKERLIIDFLINNAGFGMFNSALEADAIEEEQMVNCHLLSSVWLARAIAKNMVQRKCGYILNVSSVYAFCPVPYQSFYAASKSFIFSSSLAMHQELKNVPVSVTALCPGETHTSFRKKLNQNKDTKNIPFSKSPEYVASVGYKAALKGRPYVVPGIKNKLLCFLVICLPIPLKLSFIYIINNLRKVNQ